MGVLERVEGQVAFVANSIVTTQVGHQGMGKFMQTEEKIHPTRTTANVMVLTLLGMVLCHSQALSKISFKSEWLGTQPNSRRISRGDATRRAGSPGAWGFVQGSDDQSRPAPSQSLRGTEYPLPFPDCKTIYLVLLMPRASASAPRPGLRCGCNRGCRCHPGLGNRCR